MTEEAAVPEVVVAETPTPEVPAEPSTAEPVEPVQPSEEDLVRKRIDKIVWQREEQKRRADYWEAKAKETKPEARNEEKPESDPTKPSINDTKISGDPKFKSYEDFTEALAEWKVEQRIQKAHQEFQTRTQAEKRSETLKTFNDRAAKVRDKYPDYDELFENATVSQAMAEPIMDSESGPEIVVYLSKNPDVAAKLSQLSPTQAAREIGKIEAKLDSLLVVKSVTDAKPPLTPVKPKGELPSGLDDSLDIKEWMRRRNKQAGR